MDIQRLTTGVPALDGTVRDLDEALSGGIPQGNVSILSGTVGSGKTILGLQFLMEGARLGQSSTYVSFNQSRQEVMRLAGQFWPVQEYVDAGLFKINSYNLPRDNPVDIRRHMLSFFRQEKPVRAVIDTLTMYLLMLELVEHMHTLMGYNIEGLNAHVNKQLLLRLTTLELFDVLKSVGTTTLAVTERVEECARTRLDTIPEFHADGVVVVSFKNLGKLGYSRTLQVREMRYTPHSHSLYQTRITDLGLVLGKKIGDLQQ